MLKKKSRANLHPRRALPPRIKVALSFARSGWSVFPLEWLEDGDCSCSNLKCSNAGKQPEVRVLS
jgi:hypothetical protein